MFAADCPTKRASSFITDMTLGRWSHVPAFQFVCVIACISICVCDHTFFAQAVCESESFRFCMVLLLSCGLVLSG